MFGIADKVTANHRDFTKPTQRIQIHYVQRDFSKPTEIPKIRCVKKLKIENPNPDHFSCIHIHSIYTKSNIPNKEI
jgi:hypothetical protein